MIVVIDTNVLVRAANATNPLHAILAAWLQRKFLWAISNDILTEYEEVIARLSGADRWRQLARVLDLATRSGDLLLHVSPSFQYRVVSADPDDNKFCDCAITVNADFVITDDAHFEPLKEAGYRPRPISSTEFIQRHLMQ